MKKSGENILIWYDLLALPPKVFAKRLFNRLLKKPSNKPLIQVDESPKFSRTDNIKLTNDLNSERIQSYILRKYLSNQADYLGTGWITIEQMGSNKMGLINWNKDFKSGFEWNPNLSSNEQLALGLKHPDADIKIPWEFSRFQLSTKAAVISLLRKDQSEAKKCYEHFQSLLVDFNDQNKIGYGVHWVNAMEVSIRAINLMVCCDLYAQMRLEMPTEIHRIIQQHLSFVFSNLESKDGFGNNHYLSNILALLFGLVYYPSWTNLQRESLWIQKEFIKEINKQFFDDGGNFEGSTYYHKLSTEIAILGLACLYKIQPSIDLANVSQKIDKAVYFLKSITKPNTDLPQFGDNDSGSILPMTTVGMWISPARLKEKYINLQNWTSDEEEVFHENVLNCEAVFKYCDGLLKLDKSSPESSFISSFTKSQTSVRPFEDQSSTFPMRSVDHFQHVKKWEVSFPKVDINDIQQFYFRNTGVVVLKNEHFYLALSLLNRDEAHRYRGHFHNDQLSIELMVNNENVLSDPGCYTYTGNMDIRNKMRSAKAHNAPYFGVEPNPFMDGVMGLFHQRNYSECILHFLSKEKIMAELKFGNYRVLREINLYSDKIEITDSSNQEFKLNKGKSELMSDGYGRLLRV